MTRKKPRRASLEAFQLTRNTRPKSSGGQPGERLAKDLYGYVERIFDYWNNALLVFHIIGADGKGRALIGQLPQGSYRFVGDDHLPLEQRATAIFGKTWQTVRASGRTSAADTLCQCCDNPATRLGLHNTWGCVEEFAGCDTHHALYHGKLSDGLPSPRALAA